MKSLAANGAKNQALLGVDENQTDGFLLFLSLFLSLQLALYRLFLPILSTRSVSLSVCLCAFISFPPLLSLSFSCSCSNAISAVCLSAASLVASSSSSSTGEQFEGSKHTCKRLSESVTQHSKITSRPKSCTLLVETSCTFFYQSPSEVPLCSLFLSLSLSYTALVQVWCPKQPT